MMFVIFVLIVLCNYVALADVSENSKILFFTLVAVFFILRFIITVI